MNNTSELIIYTTEDGTFEIKYEADDNATEWEFKASKPEKIANSDGTLTPRELTSKYGALSGYAQQYFFYYYRENRID